MRRGLTAPSWHKAKRHWRVLIDGKKVALTPGLVPGFEEGITRDEQPQFMGIPVRAWECSAQLKAMRRCPADGRAVVATPGRQVQLLGRIIGGAGSDGRNLRVTLETIDGEVFVGLKRCRDQGVFSRKAGMLLRFRDAVALMALLEPVLCGDAG